MSLELALGVKSDPIEYRYSHPWLFDLLAEEGISLVQIGSHFEMYQLPDEFFHELREQAQQRGIRIASMFTAHRELGGFFREEPGYEQVARRNYERMIEIGGILGADSVGSNPGALLRDRLEYKPQGLACYLQHMRELMHYAHQHGVKWLTIEPMSCLAEPPTLPDENASMGKELSDYHRAHESSTAQVGYCTDIAHGYSDANKQIVHTPLELFRSTLPYLYELHLKNTDSLFNSTFGFTAEEREKGIIQVRDFRDELLARAEELPVQRMVGYLEIGGPKLGRDYSDHFLEPQLRESLRYLREAFLAESNIESLPRSSTSPAERVSISSGAAISTERLNDNSVLISPSMMCVDAMNFEQALRDVEQLGVDMLHMDIMDGHFVPNMPMGLGVLEQLGARTSLPIDVHLMVEDNDFFVEQLSRMRVDQISVHLESCVHLDRTLTRVREIGAKAGVALNPGTPLEMIEYVLERLDYVLIMTVNPGYAGQQLTPASIRKIADCRAFLDRHDCPIPIQVDGNVSFENIPPMVAAGAANLVAGTSSIFHRDGSWPQNFLKMQSAIAAGLNRDMTVA